MSLDQARTEFLTVQKEGKHILDFLFVNVRSVYSISGLLKCVIYVLSTIVVLITLGCVVWEYTL